MSRTDARRLRSAQPLPALLSALIVAVLLVSGVALTPSSAEATQAGVATTSPAAASRAGAFDALRLGDRGPRVRFAQRVVERPVTGQYGPPTRDAIKRFQRTRGISVSGVVNLRTWDALQRHWRNQMRSYRDKYRRILSVARAQFGDPYAYGAAGPGAFDCSGYTMYVYRQAISRSLPHLAGAQYYRGQRISRSQARPGDLVFFHSGSGIYHAAIWAGRGYIYHSPRPGSVVQKDRMWSNDVWFARYITRP